MLVQADVVNLCQTQGPTVSRELPGTKSYAAVAPVLSPVKLIEPPMGSTTSDTVEHSSLIGASPRGSIPVSACQDIPGARTTTGGVCAWIKPPVRKAKKVHKRWFRVFMVLVRLAIREGPKGGEEDRNMNVSRTDPIRYG